MLYYKPDSSWPCSGATSQGGTLRLVATPSLHGDFALSFTAGGTYNANSVDFDDYTLTSVPFGPHPVSYTHLTLPTILLV